MLKRIKTIMTSLSLLVLFAVPAVAVVGQAGAQEVTNQQNSLCQGSTLAFSNGGNVQCSTVGNDAVGRVNKLIANIVNIISIIVGIIAVIMIIIGALRFITSGGDSGKVASARSTIIYAIVGLVIVALAQFIVKFVLAKATGVDNANATI